MAVIDKWFTAMLDAGGSDLHLEEGQRPKIRLNGEIVEFEGTDILKHQELDQMLSEIDPDDVQTDQYAY